MKKIMLIGLLMLMSGCSGIELGGKLGVYAVDEKQESQRTYDKPQRMSLKCLWFDCSSDANEGVK